MTFPHVPPSPQLPIQPVLVGRQAMIIVGALMFGLLNFAGSHCSSARMPNPTDRNPLYFALGSAAVMVALRFFSFRDSSRRQPRVEPRAGRGRLSPTAGDCLSDQKQSSGLLCWKGPGSSTACHTL